MPSFLNLEEMSENSFIIIGLTEKSFEDNRQYIKRLIDNLPPKKYVFSGGIRHYNIVKSILPKGHQWIEITIPLKSTLFLYRDKKNVIIFASGDPLFYGLGETLLREFPTASIEVIPFFNSLQLLAHKTKLPYGEMKCISLTGRDWVNLDAELIRGENLIGVLTDRKKTPQIIAQRMREFGYTNYTFFIGENLGSLKECVSNNISINEVINREFIHPNCLILKKVKEKEKYFGIPDSFFSGLKGRPNMITKMPARLVDMAFLDLNNRKTLWDIGFCTGSISIEAKLSFPNLKIIAFEKREECKTIMEDNAKRFGALGIEVHIDDFFNCDLTEIPKPDAVFIGGYSGKLEEMIKKIKTSLYKSTTIVFNSVSEKSGVEFCNNIESIGAKIISTHRLLIDNHNTLTIYKAIWEC